MPFPIIDPQEYERSRAVVRDSLPEADRPKFDKAVKLTKDRHQLDGKTGTFILERARDSKTREVQWLKYQIHQMKRKVERCQDHVDIAQTQLERPSRQKYLDQRQAEAAYVRLSNAELDLIKLEEELALAKEDLKALK